MTILGTKSPFGHRLVGSDGTPLAYSAATLTAIKAIPAAERIHGMNVLVDANPNAKMYRFHSTSAVTGDNHLVITPDAGDGRWLLVPGAVDLSFAFTFATADAAVLYTFPTGSLMQITNLYYDVSTTFAGGSSSGIGVSSGKTGFSTKGDLVAETVAAALTSVAGIVPGTVGAGIDTVAKLKTALFKAGDTIRHDRTTSAFTSGVADLHVVGVLLKNAGA